MDILGGIGSAVSGLANSAASILNTKRTIEANKKMAEYQYSKDLEMWNRQNEYNTPSAQMQRLQAGGLNPNLVYGQGVQGATGQAKEMPKYNAPRLDYNYQAPNILQALGQFADLKIKNVQRDKLEEEVNQKKLQNQFLNNTMFDRVLRETWLRQLSGSKAARASTEEKMRTFDHNLLQWKWENTQKLWETANLRKHQADANKAVTDSMISGLEAKYWGPLQVSKALGGILKVGAGFGTARLKSPSKLSPRIKKPTSWNFSNRRLKILESLWKKRYGVK